MTTLDFLTLIEQDVQKMSSFAYEDMEPAEICIQANKVFYSWLDSFTNEQPKGNRMDDTEARMNDIRTLVVRGRKLSLTQENKGFYVSSFPEDYLYLVSVEMRTLYESSNYKQVKIEPKGKYILKSSSLSYNNINYTKNEVITGVYEYPLQKTDIVYRLGQKRCYARIVRNEELAQLNDTYYGKTNYRNPLVGMDENGMYFTTLGTFFIDYAKLDYIRMPALVDYTQPEELIDLPENGAYKLAKLTVQSILEITEQPQQKIENLKLTK